MDGTHKTNELLSRNKTAPAYFKLFYSFENMKKEEKETKQFVNSDD
jgi:hypothetical protein